MNVTPISPPQEGTPAAQASEEIRRAARVFEEILLQTLVSSMRGTVSGEEGGLMGSGPGTGVYEGFFDEGIAQAVAPRLNLGLAEALIRQIAPSAASVESGSSPDRPAPELPQTATARKGAPDAQVRADPADNRFKGVDPRPLKEMP